MLPLEAISDLVRAREFLVQPAESPVNTEERTLTPLTIAVTSGKPRYQVLPKSSLACRRQASVCAPMRLTSSPAGATSEITSTPSPAQIIALSKSPDRKCTRLNSSHG